MVLKAIVYLLCNQKAHSEYMKVKQEILDQINNVKTRMAIANRLGTGEQNIVLAMRRNSPNGRMTKMDFLKAVEAELNIPVGEILEVEQVGAEK